MLAWLPIFFDACTNLLRRSPKLCTRLRRVWIQNHRPRPKRGTILQSVTLRSSERRRVQLQACAPRQPYWLCCDTSAGSTPRSIETTTLVSIQWRAANNAPDPACVGASLHVGPEDRRQNVRAPRRRKSRRPIRSEPLHARRRARRSGFGRRNRDGQLARALGGAGLRRSFLRPRVVRGISPRIRDSSLRDPFPTHPCLVFSGLRVEI